MESGQASGQLPPAPKMGEQQAQLDVTCLSLAKGKKKDDPPTGNSWYFIWYFPKLQLTISVVRTDANIPTNSLIGCYLFQGNSQAEVQLCYLEAQRDAVEQMSLKLYSEQYNSSSKRKEEFADMSKVHTVGSNGLLDFDSEYQELWDWLIDMESIVMDSHDLMMSEEQQQHLYKVSTTVTAFT
ncbi:hypothetical protein DUI87_23168 [Hirundo rustica rustica]|uniref:Uncharacterized protein n=1 Tax=Hirundo rustica rustica TaxID=333673 RepID=A0A3M0JHH9_HIRRU|nr:hypothetical protein DUI87_23168 [Hirundo rustica rustica]